MACSTMQQMPILDVPGKLKPTLDSAMLMTNIIARWTAEPLDARPLSRAA